MLAQLSERGRLLDLETGMRGARLASYAAVAITLAVLGRWIGWLPLAFVAVLAVAYELLIRGRLANSEHPERLVAAGFVLNVLAIGLGAVVTGGPKSPLLPWLVMPIVSLAGRHDGRGVWAGTGFVVVVLALVTFTEPAVFAEEPARVLAVLPLVVSICLFSVAMMRAERRQRDASALDALTGLLNRRSLEDRFAELAEQARLSGDAVALLAIDVDHFKSINDTYGHARGDTVLHEIAAAIRAQLRSFELAYRVGGEEFLVVLPGVDVAQASDVGERLRAGLEALRPDGVAVTVSVGVSAGRGEGVRFERLYGEADDALYAAKRSGRNRVLTAEAAAKLTVAA